MKKRQRILYFLVIMVPLFSQPLSEERVRGSDGSLLLAENYGEFEEPWAMVFLPGGELLVTEKAGRMILFDQMTGSRQDVAGIPAVAYAGQGGLGDVILHPRFESNNLVYFSYAEEGRLGNRGAAVARARLVRNEAGAVLENPEVIWRQNPKVSGNGHYSHRMAFGPDGSLYITSGERQKGSPAQSWTQNLGKIIRLNEDGTVPADNPFQDKGELAKTFWTLGHRNLLGIAFDDRGRLWAHEMGPRHGDEFNLIIKGDNYGWPLVSWGNEYSGADIPDHDTRPDFHTPEEYWVPTIAPSGLIIYDGGLFPGWKGNALIGGLASQSLVRVAMGEDGSAGEVERFDMKRRIREVEQGPDGAIWVLEDRANGRLRRLSPVRTD
nr:PQQ-dependent sugar dehydrogenase [uncultured Sphaerochaeta sp.]